MWTATGSDCSFQKELSDLKIFQGRTGPFVDAYPALPALLRVAPIPMPAIGSRVSAAAQLKTPPAVTPRTSLNEFPLGFGHRTPPARFGLGTTITIIPHLRSVNEKAEL